ncbi:hypothetical protein POJ06DRAFT_256599 [Lipomyces tetrasporus]|uniref:Enoyl reductase (ER) domain-containing protein n=1 Tax=Lipomyces tetrasporus TaxID=54092 RepID=A0AAD7QQ96_9ASCO|nr:uncharacterized protein POJ06DRAFT_256599 [Lipomyces tetrasporus]KAJ8099301.1 hypothetical protein POJ06DRAFT_256599 [Lipomyces tetrasporus]
MSSTMKAIEIKDGKGAAEALYLSESVPAPEAPGTNEAIVKVSAFALNRMDIIQRKGNYPVPPGATSTLGVEFSGTVERIGPDSTTDLKVGDRVFGLAAGGAYAEYIRCSTKLLLPYTEPTTQESTLTFIAAAGIPEVWFTATQALLKIAEIHTIKERVKNVLIHAGASGVGIAALQLARSILGPDVKLFATVGTDAKVKFVESFAGADYGINYKKYDFVKFISDKTEGLGVDVIVDFIGQDYFMKNITVAARDARIVLLATMSGSVVEHANIGMILYKRLRIEGSTLRSRTIGYQSEIKDLFQQYGLPKLISGEFVNPVDKVFSWNDIVQAHKYMESNVSMGKIVCVID